MSGKIILPGEYLPGQFRVLVPDQRCSLCGGKQLFVAVDGVVLHGAQQHLLGRDFFDQGLASFGLRKVIRLQSRDSTTKVVGLGLCTGSFRLHPSHLRARQGQLRQIVPPCLGHACCCKRTTAVERMSLECPVKTHNSMDEHEDGIKQNAS